MKNVSKILLGTIVAAAFSLPMAAHADGKALFEGAKCNKCHSIKAWGVEAKKANKAPDLSEIKDLKSAQDIMDFVSRKKEKKAIFGKKKGQMIHHKKKYTKPDLKDIAAELAKNIK